MGNYKEKIRLVLSEQNENNKLKRISIETPEYIPYYRCILYSLLKKLCQQGFGVESTNILKKSEVKKIMFNVIKRFYNCKMITKAQKDVIKADRKNKGSGSLEYLLIDVIETIEICKKVNNGVYEFDKKMIKRLTTVFNEEDKADILKALDGLLKDLSSIKKTASMKLL
ncbi:unnamed protein product [Moneuplotes crassus]|uniref:Uncharacterized protein n=1 Tax=Euplotes crassus TaxID=5936 RepID=A0AAD1XGT1_EUPCR|nr:unnamed protein product [Moneuplotes crassus]